MKNAYNFFVLKLEAKRPLGKPRRWWKANIRIYVKGYWRRIQYTISAVRNILNSYRNG